MPERFNEKPWAITRAGHETIIAHMSKNITAEFGDSERDEKTYEISDSIAIIEITGSLQKNKRYWWTNSSYYKGIYEDIKKAAEDDSVKAICLKIDSPGGIIDGVKELSDKLFKLGKIKNIYSYADGEMCSAAYWIGSPSKVIAAPATAYLGSIGVRMMHIDRSKALEENGINVTYITGGKYKAMGNPETPLDKESTAYFQHHIDSIYTIFIEDVARNRGVSVEEALKMAEGKIFIGKEAKEIGLIDRIEESFETFIGWIKKTEEVIPMDLEEFKKKHPELFSQVKQEGFEAGRQEGKASSDAEVKRVIDIASAIVSDEKAGEDFKTLVESGATLEQIKTFKNVMGKPEVKKEENDESKEKESREKILEGLKNSHSTGVKPQTDSEDVSKKDIESEADSLLGLLD